jgi:hypothetical protein
MKNAGYGTRDTGYGARVTGHGIRDSEIEAGDSGEIGISDARFERIHAKMRHVCATRLSEG